MYVLRFWKKSVDTIGTLTTKLPGQRQLALLQVVYTANAHTIWCEQADNLPWSYFLKPKFWRCSEVYKKAVTL